MAGVKRWQDTATCIVSTTGSRDEILAGKGEERWMFRRLSRAELDRCDALMKAWDAERATREAA